MARHHRPPPAPHHPLPQPRLPSPPLPAAHRLRFESGEDKTCKHGRVYVYDLPATLNRDLISNCEDLDPWSSRCNAVSNGGFGPPAAGLGGVVPEKLAPAWYWTDMYAAEVIYHTRTMSYRCRTQNPGEATAFYIPFYAGLAVGKYLWSNYTSKDRDRHAEEMVSWIENQDPFKNSNGSDHFIMLGRLTWDFRRLTDSDDEWGTKLIYMPSMKNVVRLGVEKSQWDDLEISVPYPTAFHPRSESDIRQWQDFIRARTRASLFTFVGATRNKIRNDFRGVLMGYCKNEASSCRVVDCSETLTQCYDGAPTILEAFLDSDFCLQPKGDGFTRRSAFDCMLAGSIPVYFWKGSFEYQYEWHLPRQASAYSVFVDRNVVRNDTSVIKRVLEGYSRKEVRKMRETIIDFLPRMLYSRFDSSLGGVSDAFELTMEKVLRRFKQQKKEGEIKKVN
ncbi:xyloglucan galactosyltransferase katamari1 homolog [Phtheirospermum japonicum]|uniref:Xyloglucan galactosyltransferase katamari1 homolog n=1 Tax=Phtheirospermum japonicum TaxID=374723 RepID=A0A830CAZ8_9LAMI|nr:xyloglucan galactosyltransferase katamari1 homolog [Phtheirospermum japonicum]